MIAIPLMALALAQEPEKPDEAEILRPITAENPLAPSPQQDMVELFRKVERRLVEIDELLDQAGAGETGLSEVEESGIGDLLRGSMTRGEQVLEDIDAILELARQNGGSCSKPGEGQGGQSDQPLPGSPLDQQRGQRPQERERTPDAPGEEQQRSGQEPSDPRPDSPGEERDLDSQNRPAPPPDERATGPGSDPSGADKWGELPQHVREIFRTEGGDDLPPQYRDWIEGYYRRLNERRKN